MAWEGDVDQGADEQRRHEAQANAGEHDHGAERERPPIGAQAAPDAQERAPHVRGARAQVAQAPLLVPEAAAHPPTQTAQSTPSRQRHGAFLWAQRASRGSRAAAALIATTSATTSTPASSARVLGVPSKTPRNPSTS